MTERARPKHTMAVVAVFALVLSPHVSDLPAWVTAWCLVLWGWALAIDGAGWRPPPAWLRHLLLLAGLAGAVAGYFPYELWRLGFASAALAVLLGVKALELGSHRGRMAALLLAWFLVVAKVLDTLSLEMAVYALAVVLASAAAMVRLNTPLGRWRSLAVAGFLMLRALPLLIVLFLFFPRAEGGASRRWGVGGMSGFSDTLSPGDLARLARNHETAFRVSFDGPAPRPEQRYWRGVVLWNYDGRAWRRGSSGSQGTSPPPGPNLVDYELTMEPTGRPWVFTLDAPVAAPPGLWLSADRVLSLRGRLTRRRAFSLRSAVGGNAGPALRSDERGLRLPGGTAPETRALGRSWRDMGLRPEAVVETAMTWLGTGGFTYSLDPPLAGGADPTDGFLFGTRQGYCGHYASAMAVLLRSAGVPARLVVGYQGGGFNRMGGFLTVRQSDAHAWCEALLPGRGWVRVDPTTAVAPGRATGGTDAALGGAAGETGGAWFSWPTLKGDLAQAWDAMSYHLDPWVTDLAPETQRDVLSRLGLRSFSPAARLMALVAAVALAAVLACVRFRALRPRLGTSRAQRARRLYLRFCRRLERAGLPRPPWQGPLDHAEAVAERRPDLAGAARAVAWSYAKLRYGDAGPDELGRLRRMVRRFRPGSRPGFRPGAFRAG